MLMRKSKGQRTSGWSVLKFKNMLMSPSRDKGPAGGQYANEGTHSITLFSHLYTTDGT